uniref:Uncharacterized protein n=1 Tax=Anguilla anguilla TaxID=7936 RepID=A0A0E9RXH7_ANGAN
MTFQRMGKQRGLKQQ